MGGRILAALVALGTWAPVAGVAGPDEAARATGSETVVTGCNERNSGEIGIRELVGTPGDTVRVAVTVHSRSAIDSFSLDVSFPTSLLRFVRAEPGNLTGDFFFFAGSFLAAESEVRLSGAAFDAIVPGTTGTLGYLVFEIEEAGEGTFGTRDYLDDIAGYSACEESNAPNPVEPESFGVIKIRYR